MEDARIVVAVEAFRRGGINIVLADNGSRSVYRSTSRVIQETAISACLSAAKVVIETEGKTDVVKRIDPFSSENQPSKYLQGKFVVSRVATQRVAEGHDHLEVFLADSEKPDGPDTAFNVFDPLLQRMFLSVFQWRISPGAQRIPINVVFDGKSLVGVKIGDL